MKVGSELQGVLLGSLEEQVMLAVVRTGEEADGMNVRRELETVTGGRDDRVRLRHSGPPRGQGACELVEDPRH